MPRIRARTVPAVALAAVASTLSGCTVPMLDGPDAGGNGRKQSPSPSAMDSSGLKRGTIPAAAAELDKADLPRSKPSADASIEERTARRALREVSVFARTADPNSESECTKDPDVTSGLALDCTVTFRGTEYSYTYSHRADGSQLEPFYTAPVLREVVEADLRFDEQTRYVRCDMKAAETVSAMNELPELPCAYLDRATGQQERVDASVTREGEFTFLPAG